MKIFIEDLKGFVNTFNDVKKAEIIKQDNKNVLLIQFEKEEDNLFLPLTNIRLFFLIDSESLKELFRYEK